MATLEVHRGEGGVERYSVSSARPLTFGSSPRCEISLKSPAGSPILGRIRFKDGRLRVEASKEADAVDVNGKTSQIKYLRQGDEIRVGDNRIFVITNVDLDEDAGDTAVRDAPAASASSPPAIDRTPIVSNLAALFEMDAAPPSVEDARPTSRPIANRSTSPPPAPFPRSRFQSNPSPSLEKPRPEKPADRAKPIFRDRLRSFLPTMEQAPGDERVLSSPVVVGLAITLSVLLLSSWGLWTIIRKTSAHREYGRAVQALEDADYRSALRRFDEFMSGYPDDPRVGKARLLRGLASVRQFVSVNGGSWSQALRAATRFVDDHQEDDGFDDEATELVELLVKTAEGLADNARSTASPGPLNEANEAIRLIERVAGAGAKPMIERSRFAEKSSRARAAIERADARAGAFSNMDASVTESNPSKVYAERDRLVSKYPDMASDGAVIERIHKANELIRAAVKFDESLKPAEKGPRREAFDPPLCIVRRSALGKSSAAGSVLFVEAEGFVFGLDAETGAPLWRSPVGPASPFSPLPLFGGEPSALVMDARFNELARLDARTGSVIWRQSLENVVESPPLVAGNQIIQPLPNGELALIDFETGDRKAVLRLGRPLAGSPVLDETGRYLYQAADEDCLFIIDRESWECVEVAYLGHEARSIQGSSARIGRFLVIPENHGLGDGRLRICLIDETGAKLRAVQVHPVAGWTWHVPSNSGAVLWTASDRGEIQALSLGSYDAPDPIKLIASMPADADSLGPAFVTAISEREAWVAYARPMKLELNSDTGKLTSSWNLGSLGPALAPIRRVDNLAILTHQEADGPGVIVLGVDPRLGVVRWRTLLGSDPPELEPWNVVEGQTLALLGTEGGSIGIDEKRIRRGGFIEEPLSRPGGLRVPRETLKALASRDGALFFPSRKDNHLFVRSGVGEYKLAELPASPAARPAAWGDEVFVPSSDGRAYLVDPSTGEAVGEPFIPPYDRSKPSEWLDPISLPDDGVILADRLGRVRRLARAPNRRARIVVASEVSLNEPIRLAPESTGKTVFFRSGDRRLRAFSSRDLTPTGAWSLDSPMLIGPTVSGGLAFAADAAGDLICLDDEGRKRWQVRLKRPAAGTAPVLARGAVYIAEEGGLIEARDATDGSSKGVVEIGLTPISGLRRVNDEPVIPLGRGVFSTLGLDAFSTKETGP